MADVLIYWRDHAANRAYQFSGDRAYKGHRIAKRLTGLDAQCGLAITHPDLTPREPRRGV